MATLNVKSFPDPLYEEIKARARRERRSVAQEVIRILSRAVESERRISLLELKGLGKGTWAGTDAARRVAEERSTWD